MLVAEDCSVRFTGFLLVQDSFAEVALEAQNTGNQVITESLFDNLNLFVLTETCSNALRSEAGVFHKG